MNPKVKAQIIARERAAQEAQIKAKQDAEKANPKTAKPEKKK